ncbi:MAG: hypothetical protein EXR83_09265 [Gammaproteobacteria bacterium]|nr:hypothetical protein [Gammaproteobacteria bacterium]
MNSTGVGLGVWAGLGLFFVGLRMLTAHLRQLGGGNLQTLLASWLGRPLAPQLVGLTFGALTQSTSAVTLMTSGLVLAGALVRERALPMLAWANVGTSALVRLTTINSQALVLGLLGATGLDFFLGFEQSEKYRHALMTLWGLGLLLFGLTLLKHSVAALGPEPWMRAFVEFSGAGVAIALLAGFVMAVAMQSSSIVTVLALPLVVERLLGLDQALLLIYGASVGSGCAVFLLASGMEGVSRQLSLCLAALRAITALALLGAFFFEKTTGVPLVLALREALSRAPATQCAMAYLLVQLLLVLTSQICAGWLLGYARRSAPPSALERLMKPHFIFDDAAADPPTALALVVLEQQRLVKLLPDFLEDLLPPDERSPTAIPIALRAAASIAIATEMDYFLRATLQQNPGLTDAEEFFVARAQLDTLRPLQSALQQFVAELLLVPSAERPVFTGHLVAGLHAILMVAADTAAGEPDAAQTLHLLTHERSALLERVRHDLLDNVTNVAGRESALSATLTFERISWLLRRLMPAASASAVP